MPAPILSVESTIPTVVPKLTLDANRLTNGFWSTAKADGVGPSIRVYGTGATPGFLLPGKKITIPIHYLGLQQPWDFSVNVVNLQVRIRDAGSTEQVNWNDFTANFRPPWMADDAWQAVMGSLSANVGSTWGQFVSMLSDNATALHRLGRTVTDVDELFRFEFLQANGLSPVGTLTSVIDAAMPTPGLTLSFGRSYANTVTERHQVGLFGRGWSAPSLARLEAAADGTVTIYFSADSFRRFLPDTRYVNRYLSSPGDSGVLRRVSTNGPFELKETGGQIMRFHADGKLDFIEDVNGHRITYGHTGNQLTSMTHSSGASLTFTYNAAGLIASIADSAGRTTTYTYDPTNSQLLMVTSPLGTTLYGYYDSAALPPRRYALLSIQSPGGVTQSFDYDARGRLVVRQLNNGAEQVTYTYGTAGQVTVTDATGSANTYFFDHQGRVAREENTVGGFQLYDYDLAGRLIRSTDAQGGTQLFSWCSCGQLVSAKDQLGNTIRFTPGGPQNRPVDFTDARGFKTSYSYDAKGNLLRTTYPDGTIESATYNAAGLVASQTNRRGQAIAFSYNSAGQVTQETFPDNSTVTYAYDARGRMTSAVSPQGTIALTYDTSDRLTRIDYPGGRWLQFSYDAGGRRSQMVDQDGFTVKYTYDVAGRLTALRDATDAIINSYTYDAAGRVIREDKGNGTFSEYSFDAAGRIISITHRDPGGAINSQYGYAYDVLGRRVGMTAPEGAWTYTYDLAGQLTHAVFVSADTNVIPHQDLRYEYDAAGNRTKTVLNGVTTIYTTNPMNQYTSAGSTTFAYDPDGNLIQENNPAGTTTYGYDVQNQLISVNTPGGLWQYEYNPFGNRTASIVNGNRTDYLLDPAGLVNVVGEFDGTGMRTASYVHGIGLEATNRGGTWGYYDFDAIGSAIGISAISGAYINRYAYKPYGEVQYKVEAVSNSFTFIGAMGVAQESDGLLFMRARYFKSSLGRFSSQDPIRLKGGDPNLYGYVKNAPTLVVDPGGMDLASAFKFLQSYSCHSEIIGMELSGQIDPNAGMELEIQTARDTGSGAQEFGRDLTNDLFGPPKLIRLDRGRVGLSKPSDLVVDKGLRIGRSVTGLIEGGMSGCRGYFGPNGPPSGGNPGGSGQSRNVVASDPNEKETAAGFGPQAFIPTNTIIPYKIKFENLGPGSDPVPTQPATAPAQRVEVTDQLSTNLDWTTFQFLDFGFGDTTRFSSGDGTYYFTTIPMTLNNVNFVVEVELSFDAATGLVRAVFQSLDPATGLPPEVLTGFLPPEDGTGIGQGYVSFAIQPLATLATGTELRNIALIRFDGQTIIATNQIDPQDPAAGNDPDKEALNTIDSGSPTSSVQTLPPTSFNPTFDVSWSGSDDMGGSGLRNFDVFVSDNGGPFTLWLTNTTATSAMFVGQRVHSYGFYSVATDNVGIRQMTPTTAQASTMVPYLPPTATIVVNNGATQRSMVSSFTVTFNEAVQFPDGMAAALQLVRTGPDAPTGSVNLAFNSVGNTVEITFDDGVFAPGNAKSLIDGNYTLKLVADKIVGKGGPLDGDGNGMGGDDFILTTHRLFGDADGNRSVTATDFNAFRLVYGTMGGTTFDYNGDNEVSAIDFNEFRLRYGVVLMP
jgi:RHS repeat-associated protein